MMVNKELYLRLRAIERDIRTFERHYGRGLGIAEASRNEEVTRFFVVEALRRLSHLNDLLTAAELELIMAERQKEA